MERKIVDRGPTAASADASAAGFPLRGTLGAILLLVVVVFALYARTARFEFVSIDVSEYLLENPYLQKGLTWDGVAWAWTAKYASNWHPLTWMSHMLDVSLFGFGPAGHNLMNAGWHALNSVLVFFLVVRCFGAPWRALFVALCFAAHPLHVESVAWIAERKDVLSTAFGLASLLAWERWARGGSRIGYALAFVALALGLCAKPMLVTWPCVLLLLDAWPFARTERGWGRLVLEKAPFFALSAASAVLTWWAQSSSGAVQTLERTPLEWRLLNVVLSYGRYLAHAVWPVDLIVYYPHPGPTISLALVAVTGVALAGALVAAFVLRRRAPWFWFGLAFYLGTLVPVIGLVQVGGQAMADRYTYVPLLGPFLALAWAVGAWARNSRARTKLAFAAAVLAVVAQCALTWRQVGLWRDSATLGGEVSRVTPESSWGWNLLGQQALTRGSYRDAAAYLARSTEVQPGDPHAWHMYGKALFVLEDYAGAEVAFRRALALQPANPAFLNHLAELLLTVGRAGEAAPLVQRALELDDDYAGAHSNRARLLLLQGGDLESAEREFRRAVELQPSFTPARNQLARLLTRRGDFAGALTEIEQVLRYVPGDMEARRGRARCLTALGREREARAELEGLVAQFPTLLPAQGDLAWLLASARDPALRDAQRAVVLAERAVAAAQPNVPPGLSDALALAYAQTGRFDLAVAAAETAAKRADALGDPEAARRIRARLAAYQAKNVDLSIPR
ncbi:MAG: tetratricopeptide repeat protein [Planctomycetota bacterium]